MGIDLVRRRLQDARRLTILTGAGVSAASGVPTFRGAGGLWRNRQAMQLATPEAFARDPVLVWEWYDWRRQVISRCAPNAAHETIARWSRRPGFTLVTQNVDGLHERAGTTGVVRYHGSIWTLKCWAGTCPDWEDLRVPLDPLPPVCPRCGALARPGVVWFGEPIPPEAARGRRGHGVRGVSLDRHVEPRPPGRRTARRGQGPRGIHRGDKSRDDGRGSRRRDRAGGGRSVTAP